MKVTGAQVRAARALLRWTIGDLADAADVGISTVQAIERADGVPVIKGGGVETTLEHRESAREAALAKVVSALTDAGITFLAENAQGVGVRGLLK